MQTATIYTPDAVWTVTMDRQLHIHGTGYELRVIRKATQISIHTARTEVEAYQLFNALTRQIRTENWQ